MSPTDVYEFQNIMRIKTMIIMVVTLLTFKINAQKTLSIAEVIDLTLNNSNKIKIIENEYKKINIESSFYQISLLPKVSASISFPYQRSISEVLQSDGSQKFIERNFLSPSINLNISQIVPFTGGNFSVTSSLNNNCDFNNKTSNYSSNWANISYQQTINGFNSYKWNKQLIPLNEKREAINFLKEKIKLKHEVSKQYAEIYSIQLKIQLNRLNIDKTEIFLTELEEKFKFGRVLKLDVEQAKITLEQLKRQFEMNTLEHTSGIKQLKNTLNIKNDEMYVLEAIEESRYQIDKIALKEAIIKNSFELAKTIKLIELESTIDKVKKEGAIALNLQMGMGLNSASNNFETLYDTPAQSQFATIGAKIPILDWGKAKSSYAIAKIEKQNIEYELEDQEKKIVEQIDELSNYHLSLQTQISSLNMQYKLSNSVGEMLFELLKLGRKTIAEYKAQLVENFNIAIEHQKTINNLYLLKLKIDEITLTL
ncbi:TolC family protein [Flavobacterium sp.]|uniref:TolC family protein n=1 Tax=Flavobacterium sp. TaxID=239 RepID=UPI00286D95A5|nr:TolC family protein [Flavobacterium sp.]